jgi:hypothetical protein
MSKGWISIHREIQDHWIWQDKREFSKAEAWIDILLNVNHADQKKVIKNTLFEVKRGQSIKSQLTWAKRWNWNRSKVHRFLELLEKDKMIVLKPNSKTTQLTVCNFDSYQRARTSNEHQMNIKRTSDEHQTNINNNINNINNDNKYTKLDFFADWNEVRNTVLKKPSHLNRLNFELENILSEIVKDIKNIKEEMPKALQGFFKQKQFPNRQDYTLNAGHFLKHFSNYLGAYYDKNPNLYGNNKQTEL